MKKILALILLCVCVAQAAYVEVTMTFTNLPVNGNSFTKNGTIVRWTNAPLNNQTWIQSNSIAASATNLIRHLGANNPSFRVFGTNSTNVIIGATDLQFSIVGGYGFLTTNSLASTTNQWLVKLPWDYDFPTNRTKTADELIYGIGKYATSNAIPANSIAMTNFAGLTNQQVLFNKKLTNAIVSGGTNDATALTNIPTLGASNATIQQLNANVGTLEGFIGTNFVRINVNLAVITNLLALQTVASNVSLQSLTGAWGNVGNLTNGNGNGWTLTNSSGNFLASTFLNPVVFTGDGTAGNRFLITNVSGGGPAIYLDNSDPAGGSGFFFNFAGVQYWGVSVESNSFTILGPSGSTLLAMVGTTLNLSSSGTTIVPGAPIYSGVYSNNLIKGSNTWSGDWAFTPRADASVIAGYVSAISLGTNAYVRITGASGAFTNASFTGLRTGQRVLVEAVNPGLSCVLLHNSSIGSPASGDQINTATGNLINMTNNPATFEVINNGSKILVLWHSD